MTVCNMSIEGGGSGRICQSGRHHVRVSARQEVCSSRRGIRARGQVVAGARVRCGCSARRSGRYRYLHNRADRHVGHQSRTIGQHHRSRFRTTPTKKRWLSWASSGDAACKEHGSTSRSSVRAPTVACQTSKKQHASCAATTSRHMSRRSSCQGRMRSRAKPKPAGLHEVFRAAGFEWRGAGCSMCLGMNTDRLEGRQVCASSSNRNFKGRQGVRRVGPCS